MIPLQCNNHKFETTDKIYRLWGALSGETKVIMQYRQYFLYLVCTIFLAHSYARLRKRSSTYMEVITCNRRPDPKTYQVLRDIFMNNENSKSLGSDIELNEKESQANRIIMEAKNKEYEEGIAIPHLFTPSQHIFSALEKIKNSELFLLLQHMPKGGVLHAHDTALCSTDYLVELTYREHLWMCWNSENLTCYEMKYSKSQPPKHNDENCEWQSAKHLRQQFGSKQIDDMLRQHLTLYPTKKFLDNNQAWKRFLGIFKLLDGLLFYKPNWADYYYKALEQFYDDGVQYLEFRSTLPVLYDLEGNNYTELDTVSIYKETLDRFLVNHSEFIGSKLIYAPLRLTDEKGMDHYIKTCIKIKQKYPDFLAGFDLVGQEESGRPLKDFIPQLLRVPSNIDFLFHAGETNWFGTSVDENLIDAVLLGTKRIGHGFALLKHPSVLEVLKQRNIAIEVNPISNQVLQLVADYRNHPCAHFFADNYPVVISSDDPSFWKVTPLTHDFYIAFLGIASAHADLRLLKRLVINSLQYSSLTRQQKEIAFQKWQLKWNQFIDNITSSNRIIF